jgi:hypothetical protein
MGFKENNKLAVLHRFHSGERAQFFADCAGDRGWNVRAFERFEDAMDWFNKEDLIN